MPAVKALIEQQILLERERCARICERWAQERKGEFHVFVALADDIRRQQHPHIKLVRPETAVTKPEVLDGHTIIAGIGLHPVTDEIIDRERILQFAKKPKGICADGKAEDFMASIQGAS